MAPPGALEELALVPEAIVPIIKFKFLGVSIDMTYAPIATSNVPESLDLTDKSWLRGRDETERRSLSGTRVSDEMLQAVPQIQTFRVALRVIKLWAKRECYNMRLLSQAVPMLTRNPCCRTRHIRKYLWLSWRCSVGYYGSSHMSTLPACSSIENR